MSISIQQFLSTEGSKNTRLLRKSILLSRRLDEKEKIINERVRKINAQNMIPQKDPKVDVFAYFSIIILLCPDFVKNLGSILSGQLNIFSLK